MARRKRNLTQREQDLEKLASLDSQGWSQFRIAQELNVSRKQIYYDLQILHQRWKDSALSKVEERIARELAKLDHLEAVAWQGWERSCQDAKTITHSEETGRVDKQGRPQPDLCRWSKTAKGQSGDPRFLEQIERCIRERTVILGLRAPNKMALTSPDGKEDHGQLTDEQRDAGFYNLLAILGSRGIGPLAGENGQPANGTLLRSPGDFPAGGPSA